MKIAWERGMIWHTDCPKQHNNSGICGALKRYDGGEKSLIRCLHCGSFAYIPRGRNGRINVEGVSLPETDGCKVCKGTGVNHGNQVIKKGSPQYKSVICDCLP